MDFNPQLQLALDFVQYTGRHLFLTGKAGTGKTTFLHYLRENSPKRMIVVAPTGVAAINAGGVTIHSFFQLPFGPNVPGYNDSGTQGFKRFSAEKRNIIRTLDLLVIDEISMVRADLLDGIDQTLRRFRSSSAPFGGVQLLMIGDMQQLAPVIKDEEWRLLNSHYASPFFFSSRALQKTDYVTIELQKVYRQTDRHFIDLLNKIRDNKVDRSVSDELNRRYNPDIKPGDDGYILLTTHNARAKAVNEARLDELPGKALEYHADVEDNFPEHMYPTEPVLELKKNAQVMFIKNDPDPAKRFFNGKIGTVIDLDEDHIQVQCEGEEDPITVVPIEWQHMKYSLDQESKEITETIEGRFIQIPLKLAWAITIHKSQGLTFDKAIIDAQQAFAYGQVYVALSRCRSLEGLVLSTPFSRSTLITDRTIDAFNEQVTSNQPDEEGLAQSKNKYRQELLLQLFDFTDLQKSYYRLIKILRENKGSLQPGITDDLEQNLPGWKQEVMIVAEKFRKQLSAGLDQENGDVLSDSIQERIGKAAGYFHEKIEKFILSTLDDLVIETDNREVSRLTGKVEGEFHEEGVFKSKCLKACFKGFHVKDYLKEKALASLEPQAKKSSRKKKKIEVSEGDYDTDLYGILKAWRDMKSDELNIPVYMVLQLKTMRALSNLMPETIPELQQVHGFGRRKLERFGEEILEIIRDYREDNPNEAVEKKRKTLSKSKKHTIEISLDLWREFRDINKVAEKRGLAVSTVEGHLAVCVEKGQIEVNEVVEEKTLKKLTLFFQEHGDILLGEAKTKLGDGVTYRDLRFVKNHLNSKKTPQNGD